MVSRDRSRRRRVLIIVQNLPVPFDRRVWSECQALTVSGYQVAVVCPKGPGDPAYTCLEDVDLYKYQPYKGGRGYLSFVVEYLYSFLATLCLSLKAARSGRFAVVQTCNPPDIFWPIGLLFRAMHGSSFVFDHHDLCPELFQSRFSHGTGLIYRLLRFLERVTVRVSDHVISTNDSYRRIAMNRDGVEPERVSVVRSGPDPDRLRRLPPAPELKRGREHLVAYIGVMGPQDGVDLILRAADIVIHGLQRTDIGFTLIGGGDCYDDLRNMCDCLGLADYMEFTGRIPDEAVASILSTAELGICPDPKNPLNDVSTMNKTMEYMAFGLPVVAFDLTETRVSAGGAAAYATPNRVEELASLIVELVDDEPRRRLMGADGRARVEKELGWPHQARRYVEIYEHLSTYSPRRGSRALAVGA